MAKKDNKEVSEEVKEEAPKKEPTPEPTPEPEYKVVNSARGQMKRFPDGRLEPL
tara:strand:+ start:150 stop:311 length:162 start_codon:yes stop_codon:yes gene_type:complete